MAIGGLPRTGLEGSRGASVMSKGSARPCKGCPRAALSRGGLASPTRRANSSAIVVAPDLAVLPYACSIKLAPQGQTLTLPEPYPELQLNPNQNLRTLTPCPLNLTLTLSPYPLNVLVCKSNGERLSPCELNCLARWGSPSNLSKSTSTSPSRVRVTFRGSNSGCRAQGYPG